MKKLLEMLPALALAVACAAPQTVKMEKDSALVVVDMLYDFIDGSLACGNAENAVSYVKTLIDENAATPLFICDHHPADHSSFKDFGGIWPVHCVAGSRGGEVHNALKPYVTEELTFNKGCDREVEQYSGFEGRNEAGQSLFEVLRTMEVKTVYVVGIATEYCVYNTAKDLKDAGFAVKVLEKGLGYVDAGGHADTLARMKTEGFVVL